jgi:hypothetical protein
MATSTYFPDFGGRDTEQNLVQDLVDEQIFLFGADCKYIPRKKIIDKTMSDLILSRFEEFAVVEMFLINVEGFGSPSEMLSKFGLKITDEITFAISKRRWLNYVDPLIDTTVQTRPNEGDLIYYPLTNDLYEIKFVEREEPFYQLGNQYIFQMTAELWQAGNAQFETGDELLDDFGRDSNVFPIYLKTGGTGAFIVGEKIEQTYTVDGAPVTVSAIVAEWNATSRKLRVTDVIGQFRINTAVEGEDSGAIWQVDNFSTIDFDITDYDNAQNKYYEDKADDIIDFQEGNPFGEYGDMGIF